MTDIHFGREGRHGRTEEGRLREGGREGQRLVTGVRSRWGRASRSIRTTYHICQQFIVEFGRVSVITGAFSGEAPRDAPFLADSKTILVWWNI